MLPAKLRNIILQSLLHYQQNRQDYGFIPFAKVLPALPANREAISLQIILLLRKGFLTVPANMPSSYVDPENLEKLQVMLTEKSRRLCKVDDAPLLDRCQ